MAFFPFVTNISDISGFLQTTDKDWQGQVVDKTTKQIRPISTSDISQVNLIDLVINEHGRSKVYKLTHTASDFILSDGTNYLDYTDMWQDYLINKYGERYAKYLVSLIDKRLNDYVLSLSYVLNQVELKMIMSGNSDYRDNILWTKRYHLKEDDRNKIANFKKQQKRGQEFLDKLYPELKRDSNIWGKI